MRFFHLFFPSWRFFENSGSFIRIEFRVCNNLKIEQEQWLELTPPVTRTWIKLFYNPEVNAHLTLLNHAAQFISSLSLKTSQNNENNPSYEIIKNYVERCAQASDFYQFKFVAINPLTKEDLVISPIFQKIKHI